MDEIKSKLNQEPCSSSTPGSSYAAVPASPPEFYDELSAPDDIMQILHRYFPWETIEDIDNAKSNYHGVPLERRDEITADMAKLKELSSILKGEYDSCMEVVDAHQKRAAQPYYELVEQLPCIKSDPSYKELTTVYEKFMIKDILKQKKALKQKHQNEQIQTPPQSLSCHLEVLRGKLHNIYNDEDRTKAGDRKAGVGDLLWRVNRVIESLESVEEKFKIMNMLKDKGIWV